MNVSRSEPENNYYCSFFFLGVLDSLRKKGWCSLISLVCKEEKRDLYRSKDLSKMNRCFICLELVLESPSALKIQHIFHVARCVFAAGYLLELCLGSSLKHAFLRCVNRCDHSLKIVDLFNQIKLKIVIIIIMSFIVIYEDLKLIIATYLSWGLAYYYVPWALPNVIHMLVY